MGKFYVAKSGTAADFLIEQEAWDGVKMIGNTVAEDVNSVTDVCPAVKNSIVDCTSDRVILMATVDKSPLLTRLEAEGKISLAELKDKREVYKMQIIDAPFAENAGIKQVLVIAGSDKRGTIYGQFRVSELCGVSALVYYGDAIPEKCAEPVIELDNCFVSKVPSVKYRGFFINDEWPAFGNWCMEKFGGVNAKAYEKIFELLLRMKGNYFWPAMWNSSFSEDGPGLANAELADKMGVVMGTSHHEPLCRAGVEWQQQYKKYGNDSTWSFLSNKEAITKFWEDGMLRNRDFENVVTIGMRGESDSKLMPEDATLKDNIEVIKSAIRAQQDILRKQVNPNLKEVPQMLAIYKEVEDYYFGDETCEGLKDWEDLKDVIFLLSDDNHGNVRALPTEETRNHPGGFGMYYHFDYHGAPISYEWTNCNRLTKTWEQMTQAYESGVRDMWIVNVGDLKENEYPLSFFMELAYDYEKWGSTAPNTTEAFAKLWIDKQFGSRLNAEQKQMMADVMEGYTKWNAARTPETMREGLYHPVHFRECERVYDMVKAVEDKADRLNAELTGEALTTYQSMIYYAAKASMNLVLMYMESGIAKDLARRGCIYANTYADSITKRILDDARLVDEFHKANGGKWNHCLRSAHTGFRSWDDNDWTYPTVERVVPIPGGKSVIGFRGSEQYHLGVHWGDAMQLRNDDLTRPDVKEVLVDLDSRGNVSYAYVAEFDCPWLICDAKTGRVEVAEGGRKTLHFSVDRAKLTGTAQADVKIVVTFDNGETTNTRLAIVAANEEIKKPDGVKYLYVEKQGYCTVLAEKYNEKRDVDGCGFETISYLGREGSAIKSFPAMKNYADVTKAPYVKYAVLVNTTGEYDIDLFMPARNPVAKGGVMKFAVSANGDTPVCLQAVHDNYYTEWQDPQWSEGVLNQVRIVTTKLSLKEGVNEISIYAGETGVLFEKFILHAAGRKMPISYLGAPESYRI